jgi:hemerythrin-like domain-containing protein
MDAQLLDQLEAQHREAERLIADLENATDAAQQQPLVDQLTTALQKHMEIEEQQVYPELARLDGEIAEEAEVEHGLARGGLSEMASMVGQPGFGAAVAMVKAGISHHVDEEENEAFPKLRKSLGLSAPSGSEEPTKQELYDKAKDAGVEGRSSMTKAELAEAVGESE